MQYWYNIATGQVEEDMSHSRKDNLMGPYSSREDAAAALKKAADRTDAWDEEDRRRAEEDAEARNRDPDEPGLLG